MLIPPPSTRLAEISTVLGRSLLAHHCLFIVVTGLGRSLFTCVCLAEFGTVLSRSLDMIVGGYHDLLLSGEHSDNSTGIDNLLLLDYGLYLFLELSK